MSHPSGSRTAVTLVTSIAWHEIEDKSFSIDAYEFRHEGAGRSKRRVVSTGFTFNEKGQRGVVAYGVLTAIVALRAGEKIVGKATSVPFSI